MKNLVYIGFAFSHHKDRHAGYHRIAEYGGYDKVIDVQGFFDEAFMNDKGSILKRVYRKIVYMLFSFKAIPFFLYRCILVSHLKPGSVFHFIYGENELNGAVCLFNRKSKVVATFHQPYEWFLDNPRFIKILKRLDAVILVGNTEIDKFKSLTGKDNVYYIPHGICSDFYKPEPSVKKERILLTVGSWLRDYDFANEVYKRLLAEDPEINIHIVTSLENQKKIDSHPRIHFHNGISDEDLKLLYCRCSVLYLPLTRYTANNSLLEAGATGCNIVISSDHPDNSYLPENMITVTPLSVEEAISGIKSTMSPDYNYEICDYINSLYSWNKVGKDVETLLLS